MAWAFTEINVHAFRGVRNLHLTDLGQVNLIVGGTNSGKTSILEAISVAAGPLDPMMWIALANRREASWLAAMSSSKVDRLRYLFPSDGESSAPREGVSRLSYRGRVELREVSARMTELRGLRPSRADHDPFDSESGEAVGEIERAGVEVSVEVQAEDRQLSFDPPSNTLTFQAWEGETLVGRSRSRRPRFPVRHITPYEHWLRNPATNAFSESVLEGHGREVLELLKRIEPRIQEIQVLATQREPMLYLKDERAGFLPLSAFGDGIRRVLTLALALPRAKDGVLLIDEIETGIHTSMLSSVHDWLVAGCRDFNVQLFATTHSLESLDAVLKSDTTPEEDTVVYRLESGVNSTGVTRFGEQQIRRIRDRGMDIR